MPQGQTIKPKQKTQTMAPHSSTLAWKIPWTDEPGRLQSMGSHATGLHPQPHRWAFLTKPPASSPTGTAVTSCRPFPRSPWRLYPSSPGPSLCGVQQVPGATLRVCCIKHVILTRRIRQMLHLHVQRTWGLGLESGKGAGTYNHPMSLWLD